MKKTTLLLITLSAFILTACDVTQLWEKDLPTKLENPEEPTQYWSEVSGEYGLTQQGSTQSPINIESPVTADLPPIDISYGEVALALENTGYVFRQHIPGKQQKENVFTIDDTPYYLLYWHWHVPGEHKIKGKPAPMEIHFVHRSADDQYAVIGVMYEYGDGNLAVQALFNAIAEPKPKKEVIINIRDLLPNDLSYYHYSGSLTTPPYTEGFKWFVLQNPQTLTKADMKIYKKSGLKPNARAVQAIENRRVKKVAGE